jgi:hypothetical protein
MPYRVNALRRQCLVPVTATANKSKKEGKSAVFS